MIDCPNGDVRDALPDYLHDRLDTSRRREVEAHVAGCDACQEELALLRALHVTMRRAPAVDVEAIAATISPYRPRAARSWAMGWRAAAAIVAIAVGGTSIALLRGRTPDVREDTRPYVQAVPVPHQLPPTAVESPPVASRTPSPPPSTRPVASVVDRELVLGGGSITDLSDGELSALVEGIESLDAVPSTEVEGEQPMSFDRQEDI